MHILYIHQYFTTPLGCGGTRSYEFAKRWAAKGHKVTMLTSIAKLTDADLSAAKGWIIKRFKIDKIDVLALSVPYRQQMGALKRCLAFLAFLLLASLVVLFIKKVDIFYATSTPLTVGVPALVAKWFRSKKYIFEVRDQWPEIPIELGIIKNKIVIKLLLWLEKTIYKKSAVIVALSPGMADGVRSVLKKEKPIAVVPNSSDIEVFRPDIDGSAVRKERGWDDKLVLLHFGAIGRTNGLGFVIDAAERLKTNPDIHFVLVGNGSEKQALVGRVEQLGLRNIEILDSMSKTELAGFVAACNVSMVIFANYAILEHNSANKFFDSLSAGKPVLLNYSGWQRDILEDNKAGFGCDLCNLDEFVEKVLYLNSNRQQIKQMGQNARRIAEKKFDRNKLANQVMELIVSV